MLTVILSCPCSIFVQITRSEESLLYGGDVDSDATSYLGPTNADP